MVVINHKFLLSKRQEGKILLKKEDVQTKHCSAMTTSAWTDLNSQGNILKLHDKSPNPKCDCQKIITFTPHQYMLEGGSIKSRLKKFSEEQKSLGYFYETGPANGNTVDISCSSCKNEESSISSRNE